MAKTDTKPELQKEFLFDRKNYYLMAGGIVLIIIGFLLMSGGASEDPNVFSEEIFSFRRITLAPIVVLAGFAVVGVGIMKRFKADNAE